MKNLAGSGDSNAVWRELLFCGVLRRVVEPYGECKVDIEGVVGDWTLRRAWTYWIVSGPPVAREAVVEFDAEHGATVRARGYSGGGALYIEDGPVTTWHVDTLEGLRALKEFLWQLPGRA